MTSRSKNSIERLKRTLFKYDLEIARVEGEILLCSEKIDLLSQSTRKKDLRDIVVAKIDKENYETFLLHLKHDKTAILRNIYAIIDKYEGEYAKVFKMFYFENKGLDQISEETGIPIYSVKLIFKKLNADVNDWFGRAIKKREGN